MNAPRRLIRTVSATTALSLGALALTACGSDSDSGHSGADGDRKVNVVAAFYPLQFLAQQIGGGHVDVVTLTKPGTEPHDLELSPQQTGLLSEADLVVHLKGLQPAVDEGVAQAEPERVAEVSSYTTLEKHGKDVHGENHGHEDGHGHSADAGEQGADPHVWLDPVRYAQIAKGIGKQLAEADPTHERTYKKNTGTLVKRLHALDQDFRNGLKNKKTDTFITTHAAFGYLAERYGLRQAAVSGIDPESEPSGARMKQLHKTARAENVDTVFFESGASDKTARTLADDLRLKTGVLSPLESVKDPKSEDYFSVMHQNLNSLQTALGTV